jgi:hypothetical protein
LACSSSLPAPQTAELLDRDLGLFSLGLHPPQADQAAVAQHGPRARNRPEQPRAELGIRREQRSVGLLEIGVARRKEAEALCGRRRLERAKVLAQKPPGVWADPNLGEVVRDRLPQALRVRRREPGPSAWIAPRTTWATTRSPASTARS